MIPFLGSGGVNPSLDVNNTIYTRQLQGGFAGPTIGMVSDGAFLPNPSPAAGGNIASDMSNGPATMVGMSAGFDGRTTGKHIVGWLIGLGVLLVALMYIAKRYGSESDAFSNIKLSAYNILIITLAYIIGGNLLKAVFARYRVPGISELVLAA